MPIAGTIPLPRLRTANVTGTPNAATMSAAARTGVAPKPPAAVIVAAAPGAAASAAAMAVPETTGVTPRRWARLATATPAATYAPSTTPVEAGVAPATVTP